MESTETRRTIQAGASEAAASVRKVGGKLRTFAGNAADSSTRWARRCGAMLSHGGRLATLHAQQRVLRTKLDRGYRELGRAVYAAHEKDDEVGSLIEAPEVRAAVRRVREAAENLHSNEAKLAELRQTWNGGDSTSS